MADRVVQTIKSALAPVLADVKALQGQVGNWEARWNDLGVLRERMAVLEVKAAAPAHDAFETERRASFELIAGLEKRLALTEQRPMLPGPAGKDADLGLIHELKSEVALFKAMGWQASVAEMVEKEVKAIPVQPGPSGPPGEKGIDGVAGPTGSAGPKGDAGEPGPIGDRGERGERGEAGQPGEKGDVGPVGAKGDNGIDGAIGPQGEKGMDGVGLMGLTGPKGDQGVGIKGDQGDAGADGKDAPLPDLDAIAMKAATLIPVPKDGRDGKNADAVDLEVIAMKAAALIPTPKDGLNGKDAAPVDIDAIVQRAATLIPRPKDGQSVTIADVAPLITSEVSKAVAALPRPKDGISPELPDVTPLVKAEVERAVSGIPRAKDGVGISSALIDREGHLVVTLTDGTTKDVGPVIGKDGAAGLNGKSVDMADVEKQILAAVKAIPLPKDGKDGADGLGFDDLTAVFDEEQGFVLRFERGELRKDFPIHSPFDTSKAWEAGRRYVKGAGVRFDGSYWIAKKENINQKPGSSDAWVLSAKRGKDGKDGKNGDDR